MTAARLLENELFCQGIKRRRPRDRGTLLAFSSITHSTYYHPIWITIQSTPINHTFKTLPLLPRPWMGFVIHLGEVLEIEVGIDLGGGDIGVAEQFLYGAQVVAGFEHVAGEGVA